MKIKMFVHQIKSNIEIANRDRQLQDAEDEINRWIENHTISAIRIRGLKTSTAANEYTLHITTTILYEELKTKDK